jgi:hypothetical protein
MLPSPQLAQAPVSSDRSRSRASRRMPRRLLRAARWSSARLTLFFVRWCSVVVCGDAGGAQHDGDPADPKHDHHMLRAFVRHKVGGNAVCFRLVLWPAASRRSVPNQIVISPSTSNTATGAVVSYCLDDTDPVANAATLATNGLTAVKRASGSDPITGRRHDRGALGRRKQQYKPMDRNPVRRDQRRHSHHDLGRGARQAEARKPHRHRSCGCSRTDQREGEATRPQRVCAARAARDPVRGNCLIISVSLGSPTRQRRPKEESILSVFSRQHDLGLCFLQLERVGPIFADEYAGDLYLQLYTVLPARKRNDFAVNLISLPTRKTRCSRKSIAQR